MSVTTSDVVFIPQIIGDAAVSILFKRTPLLASGYIADGKAIAAYPGTGSKVTYPCWSDPLSADFDYMVQTTVSNSRTGVNGYAFQQSSYTEDLLEKTVSVDIDNVLRADMIPDNGVIEFYADVVSKGMARAIQADLISKAESTNLSVDITGESTKTLTVESILRARMEWGEYANSAKPALFVHSKQYKDLAKSTDFVSIVNGFNRNLGDADPNSIGPVANIHGVDLWLCDSITKTGNNYTSLMIMPDSLVLFIKDVETVDPIRHAGSRVVTLDTHFRWSSTLLRNSPRGVVKLITQ